MAVTCYPDKQYCVYFTEVQDIEDHCVDDSQDDENAGSDDGAHSAGFLNDLGVTIEDITLTEVAESSKLRDVPLTPAQRATLRRHVERVQTTLRPHPKPRADVRHLFQKDEPSSHKMLSKSEDQNEKRHHDDVPRCVTDGSALSQVQVHDPVDNAPTMAGDVPIDDEYIPPPDYSASDDVMAVPPGESTRCRSPSKHHSNIAASSDTAESSSTLCGVTFVDDLGKKDQKMLTTLAHLELMMLFDECNITYNRKKTRRKGGDHGVFNVALQTLLDKDRKKSPHLKVPLFLQELVHYLETKGLHEEGLLRVSGRLTRVKELREKIDRHYSKGKPISFDTVALHDAAALLKLFLRELPEPLLMSERVNAFIQVDNILDMPKQLYALNMLILLLPEVNRNALLMLLEFLNKVIKEPANKMTAENVAMVMAPNLFLLSSGSRDRPQPMDRELKLAVATSKITLMLLANRSSLWTAWFPKSKLLEIVGEGRMPFVSSNQPVEALRLQVPSALIDQIRQKHEDSSSANPIMRLLGSKDKTDVRNRISTGVPDIVRTGCICVTQNNMEITVKVESMGSDTKVNIDSSTTAGDVVEMIARSPQMQQKKLRCHQVTDDSLSNWCLYEVGGNIGERRLDNCANMMSVCQVNPNAKYVIRCHPE